MAVSWTLEDGLKLVRALQRESRGFGYHISLGGSVLDEGRSDKDVDLYFLPIENSNFPKANPRGVIEWLERMWGDGKDLMEGEGVQEAPVRPYDWLTLDQVRRGIGVPTPQAAGQAQARYIRDPNGEVVQIVEEEPVRRVVFSPLVDEANPFDAPPPPQNPPPTVRVAVAEKTNSAYKFKLKFNRKSGDRVDVYIL